jgi:Plasmid pRiA4b ORF-3-like protein
MGALCLFNHTCKLLLEMRAFKLTGHILVMRCLEVPLSIRLDRLPLAIQAAMGWTNSHLYEIRAKDTGWGVPDPDWGGSPLDARKACLIDVLKDVDTKTLRPLVILTMSAVPSSKSGLQKTSIPISPMPTGSVNKSPS